MDQRLVAQASPLGFPLQGDEHVRVDANGDELSDRAPQRGASHAAHRSELLIRHLRQVGEVNPAPPHTPPALSGLLDAR